MYISIYISIYICIYVRIYIYIYIYIYRGGNELGQVRQPFVIASQLDEYIYI